MIAIVESDQILIKGDTRLTSAMHELHERVFLKPENVQGQPAAERIPAPPSEDWGEANPLSYWSFPHACDSLGMELFMPKLPPRRGWGLGRSPRVHSVTRVAHYQT